MMVAPNIAHVELLFQELDFRMKSLNDVFSQEIVNADRALETCREMTDVQRNETTTGISLLGADTAWKGRIYFIFLLWSGRESLAFAVVVIRHVISYS
jgi:hypothetical protein